METQQSDKLRFEAKPMFERKSPRFLVHERVVRPRPIQEGHIPTERLVDALVQGLRKAVEDVLDRHSVPDQDRFYVSLASDRLRNASNAFFVTGKEWREQGLRAETLLENLSKMLNSNEQFELDDSFQLSVVHVQPPPRGSGPKRLQAKKKQYYRPGCWSNVRLRDVKRSQIKIRRNAPGWCAARAIVTAKALYEIGPRNKAARRQWTEMDRNLDRRQEAAKRLMFEAGLGPRPWGPSELEQVMRAPSLRDYKLVVVDAQRSYLCRVYGRGPAMIGILYDDNHYDALSSIPGFLVKKFFCPTCFKGYDKAGRHRCPGNRAIHCSSCGQNTCLEYRQAFLPYKSPHLECEDCHRSFFGPTCLQNHKTRTINGQSALENTSVCTTRQKCGTCGLYMDSEKEDIQQHKCGHAKYHCCGEYVEVENHKCFIQKESLEERNEDHVPPLHIFFDIECKQEGGKHVPNLLVCERVDEDRPRHWSGEDCVYQFLLQLEQWCEGGKQPLTVLAHNFQGYDSYPIIEKLHLLCSKLKQVRNGGKVLQLTCFKNVRFIDSMSFLPIKLSKFPKTFGLPEEKLKKGYFSHLFNTDDHQKYVGPLPPVEDYMPNAMSQEEKEAFLRWHAEKTSQGYIFHFQQELLTYCQSDVKLLKEGCLKFKEEFEAEAGFDPFDCMTMASACNRFLGTHCLEKDTIASEPLRGWGGRRVNQSPAAFEWLAWEGRDKILKHAHQGGEFRPLPGRHYTVDGYHEETRTVYEFDGCFWHGCPTCFPHRHEAHPRHLGRTMADVFKDRNKKHDLLREAGYHVISKWECEWKRERTSNPDIQDFLKDHHVPQPLDPRDAFFWGRTNAYSLYYKVKEGEEVHYYDFKSLYPFINKYGEYPVGHPEIITQPGVEETVVKIQSLDPKDCYFGLIRCTVVPPTNLLHPVLPYKCSDKLTFPLCRTCVQETIDAPLHSKKLDDCHHGDKERALTGTWCTPELVKASDKGYTLISVDQVYHFRERKKLFGKYIDTWLKKKEEVSGFPKGCDTMGQKCRHTQRWYHREQIHLDVHKIQKNPGRRYLSKQMLNSMWGKFGQATNKLQVKEFVEPEDFWKFLDSNKADIKYISPLHADRVEVHHKMQENCEADSPHLNIFIASFTTCLARLHLYEVMDKLGDRLLYSDTDSNVFVRRPGDSYQPPLGDFLGDFTNELEKEGDFIEEFCSGGPKNYGYQTDQREVVCKVRAFSLNAEGKAQLNYNVLRENTRAELMDPQPEARGTHIHWSNTIKRNPKEYSLHSEEKTKVFKLVYNKRILDPETFYTYPYRYMSQDPQNVCEPMEL